MAGRTIVITDASDGLGAAAAKRLSRSGENVVVVGRSPDKTKAVATEIGADYLKPRPAC
jgi:short-subunit dehydrogenase